MRLALGVAAFGGVGGVISWVIAYGAGQTNQFNIDVKWLSILATAAVGAACAWFAVYFTFPIDLKQEKRVLALALACGAFWHPILDAMERTVDGIAAKQTERNLKGQTEKNKKIGDQATAQAELKNTQRLLAEASKKASSLEEVSQKQKLEDASQALAATLPRLIKDNQVEGFQALGQIGQTAMGNNQKALALQTVELFGSEAPQECPSSPRPNSAQCQSFRIALDGILDTANKKSFTEVYALAQDVQTQHKPM